MWIFLALTASICWGLGYTLSEKIVGAGISPSYLLLIVVIVELPAYFLWSIYDGTFKSSTSIFLNNPEVMKNIAITFIVFTIGNLCIFSAIGLKNATHASLIEITYPIFTILFTLLLFKTWHLTPISAVGGMLIISGVTLLIYKG